MNNKIEVTTLTDKLKKLFKRDESFVLTLNGKWGVGKTYYWEKFAKKNLSDKTVAYVSLFGKDNLEDIRRSIILQISSKNKVIDSISDGVSNFKTSLGLEDSEASFGISGTLLSSVMTLMKKKDFKKIIICFDDFERLSNKLHPRDILGLISELKEEKNCKVVLILNQDKVSKKTLSTYKDKIIDFEFTYAPTATESFNAVKDKLLVFKEYPLQYFERNNINNIRVIRRVINALNDFEFIKKLTIEDEMLEREIVENIIEISIINSIFLFKKFKKLSKYSMNKTISDSSSDGFKKNSDYDKILKYIDYSAMGYFYITDITEYIIVYVQNSIVYEEPIRRLIKNRQKSKNRDLILNKIQDIQEKLAFEMNYKRSKYVVDLYRILKKYASEIIYILDSNSFIFYINELKELDSANEREYHLFGLSVLKRFLDNNAKVDDTFMGFGENRIEKIRGFDEKLEKYFIKKENTDKKEKIDSIDKIIKLMDSPRKNRSWGEEPHLLSLVKEEDLEKYILESKEFVNSAFDLIKYRGLSDSSFKEYIDRVIKIFEKLRDSDNEDYKIKMTKLLGAIDKV